MQVTTSGIKSISKLGGMVEGCSEPPDGGVACTFQNLHVNTTEDSLRPLLDSREVSRWSSIF